MRSSRLRAKNREVLHQYQEQLIASRERPKVKVNDKFVIDEDNSRHIKQDDIVDFSIIYQSPEPSWTWSYQFPDTVYSDNVGFTQDIIDNLSTVYT